MTLTPKRSLQPFQRDPQMHLALPPQHDVVGARVVDHGQRGIFLVEPQQRLAELDVVLAVGRRERHRQHRRRRLDVTSAFGAVLPLDSVSPVLMVSSLPSATVSPASAEARLVSWAPFTARMPDTRPVSPDEDCSVAPSSRWPASTPRQRQLAAVLQMHGLEHIGRARPWPTARRDAWRSRRRRAIHGAAPSSGAARRSRAPPSRAAPGRSGPRAIRGRDRRTPRRAAAAMSSSNCSISASS